MILLFTSCESDDDAIIPQNSINGFWTVAERGWIFEFSEENGIFYNTNTAGCVIQDDDFVLQDFFGFDFTVINENELIASSELSDADLRFVRLQNQNPNCLPDQVASTNDPVVNFDHFCNIFNDHYAFFEERNIDWSQFESLRNQVNSANLYTIIEDLALLLEDGHVSIIDEENGIEIESGELKLLERLSANLSNDLVLEEGFGVLGDQKINTVLSEYLENVYEIDDSENIIWSTINEDIGYINILSMEGYGSNFDNEISNLNSLLDTVINDINESGVSKLVIDIRFNDGGFDTAALAIASRFIRQEVTYFRKARLGNGFTENTAFPVTPQGDFQFTGDIVLLTSPFTISAAELFALCLKDEPNVTIVGENTSGAFSTILEHKLPNGAIVGLSSEVYSDAQGEVFEIIGIGPENQENQIPFFLTSDFTENIDSGIERALEILSN